MINIVIVSNHSTNSLNVLISVCESARKEESDESIDFVEHRDSGLDWSDDCSLGSNNNSLEDSFQNWLSFITTTDHLLSTHF